VTSELYQLEFLLHIEFKRTGFPIVTDSVRVIHSYYITFQYFGLYKLVNQQCHIKAKFIGLLSQWTRTLGERLELLLAVLLMKLCGRVKCKCYKLNVKCVHVFTLRTW